MIFLDGVEDEIAVFVCLWSMLSFLKTCNRKL